MAGYLVSRGGRPTTSRTLSLSTRKSLLAAFIVAMTVGMVAHTLHVGGHAGHDAGMALVHWLRDSLLAVPMAVVLVLGVNRLTRRWTSARPVVSRLRWGLIVGLGYCASLIPGGIAHGRLFPAEYHAGREFIHAIGDAVALLPISVYAALAVALLLGTPTETNSPLHALSRRALAALEWRPTRPAVLRASVALVAFLIVLPVFPLSDSPTASAQTAPPTDPPVAGDCPATTQGVHPYRTVTADVVALDQPFYYNRLGAINANGMIYALARDVVVQADAGANPELAALNGTPITEVLAAGPFTATDLAGNVALRPDKRARPLTLRANEGDCLQIDFTNLLDPIGFIFNLPGEFPVDPIPLPGGNIGVAINEQVDDQPLTRVASIHVDGLELVGSMLSDGSNVGQNDNTENGIVAPGGSTTYTYYTPNRGTHLAYSMGTTMGGEGNGGTRGYGLFGAVNIQPGPNGDFGGSEWYRSQLTREEMDWAASAWTVDAVTGEIIGRSPDDEPVFEADGVTPRVVFSDDGQPLINYHAVYPAGAPFGKAGLPIVEILHDLEIVHSDLNAIIDDRGFPYPDNAAYPNRGDEPFREFTVIFHDEAFGVQAFPGFYNDPVLAHTLHGVRDAFPINYGSGGIGSEIIANRLGVGPMWDCAECKYEEFFLTSFTVGDPAMIVDIPANADFIGGGPGGDQPDGIPDPGAKATMALYPGDPSNVHHAYLGDRVVFRNLHAGPKEHHIFHLHAHQWQFNPNDPQSAYLDGQAIGPGSAYTYEIAYGGSGNRNMTPGDSIFHCHFYPHFAQGMWELWRVHDTFERGTLMGADGRPAAGSRALPDGEIAAGTPIPAVVPMPGMAMAPMPDPAATIVASDLNDDGTDDSSQFDANGDGIADFEQAGDPTAAPATNPGYPWYTPGVVGHRPPTPALDLLDDGGLPRHVVTSGPEEDNPAHAGAPVEMYVSRLDFNKVLHEASAVQIPEDGTATEQVAMEFHEQRFHTSSEPIEPGTFAPSSSGLFETNGLPRQPGAPFAEPCRADDGTAITQNRTIKGANIEMPVVLNKVGWHFQQQRFEALWEDVVPTLTHARAPQPMVMRLNSTDCAEYNHTNLVPNVYQLDDYQVRTPTDIIGQHIHLVKFDVMSADGSANGWNYEDGTLSPDEVRERIEAFNNGGGFTQLDGTVTTALEAEPHPFFGATGPQGQNWLGARTTIQRWYADPLLERSWDGGVGTVFTHDHYGPSTHQQVGLYSTLLIEPEDSVWLDNEAFPYEQIGFREPREDGGPSNWQAIIVDCATGARLNFTPDSDGCGTNAPTFDAHREFYFEFADFQHAYELGGGGLGELPNENLLGASVPIPSYADFPNAINPSFRQPPPILADIFFHPNNCEGPGEGQHNLPRPCPEAISADDPGTYALNFRNEPIGLRVFNGQLGAGAGQTPGLAGDLAFAYVSELRDENDQLIPRAIAELNVQPETNGISPYPPLTSDVRPGDPWTPLLRAYMGDQVRIRVQVGAHEEEHNFTIPGLKWKQETNSPNSGWRNSHFLGIDEYFNLDIPIVPDTGPGQPAEVDYVYTVGAELEGMWNGVWGILRTYSRERNDLAELPNRVEGVPGGGNDVGRNGYRIANDAAFDGICPVDASLAPFEVTAVRAVDVLDPVQGLVYNSRLTSLQAPAGGVNGAGPLIDPTVLMYVRNEDLTYDENGAPNGLQPGTPVEPLMLRVNAGDCVEVNLTNALPADLSGTEMPGFNALPPIVHKDKDADLNGGIITFNANDITPSSYVGLAPQLLAMDVRNQAGFATGETTGKLVAPGDTERYQWYAGDVTATNTGLVQGGRFVEFELDATPVEFGAVGLMAADRIKGTENGFVGAMVVEPQNSCWIVDPGTRAQATVWKGTGLRGDCETVPTSSTDSFRDFIVVMQNDVNLRYGGIVQPLGANGLPVGPPIDCGLNPSPMACAVQSIAAEGPLGAPEDPQDTGHKAMNYGADPLWFRLGITPDTPFGEIHRDAGLADLIPDVFSNFLDIGDGLGAPGDPQVPVYAASPNGPEYGRFRVLMPGGHARGVTWTSHGHDWQRYPYINDSSEIGDNPISEYFGAQEGINPTGHWDFVVNLGGHFNVAGDYLLRDQGSFGSFQGLWGLLRFDFTEPFAPDAAISTPKYLCDETGANCDPGTAEIDLLAGAFDLDGDAASVAFTQPGFGTVADPENDGTVTFTYAPPWPCADPFACSTTFTYTVTDAEALVSNTGTVTVTVTNTAPEANDDTIVITAPATEGSVDVLANDFDAEGDLDPARGPVVDLALVDGAVLDGRTVTYTPPAGFSGVVVIPYTVTDESGATSNEATIRALVNVDVVTIDRATYRTQQDRWQVQGTVEPPSLTVEVFLNTESGPVSLGTVDVDPDTGEWSLNERGLGIVPAEGDTVFAVSSGGGISDPFPVTIN